MVCGAVTGEPDDHGAMMSYWHNSAQFWVKTNLTHLRGLRYGAAVVRMLARKITETEMNRRGEVLSERGGEVRPEGSQSVYARRDCCCDYFE